MEVSRRAFLEWSASAGLLGLAGCREGLRPLPAGVWNNAVRSIPDVHPERLAYVSSARALVDGIRLAEARGQRVRMTGSGHSFSDVAISDDVLLLPQRLNALLELDRASLKAGAAADRHLVRTQSGATLRSLNAALDRRGLAFENLGGYDAQTIVGAAMTGTHGSGLAFGPIASQIASIQIVVAGGEMLQIEPSHGITDPTKFSGRLGEDPDVPVRLVQDDLVFNAVAVSMGSMGIVYAVVLRTVDKFWIREVRALASWRDLSRPGGYLSEFVRRPRDPAFPDHVEVNVCPYPNLKGDHYCVLTQRQRLPSKPAPTRGSSTRGVLKSGNLLADARVRSMTEGALVHQLDHATRGGLVRIHWGMLQATRDKNYTDLSYKVFNLGDINLFRVYGVELAFRLQDTIAATERMFEIAAEEQRCGRNHSVPVTLRFVKASSAFLAMQEGRDSMMMEIGMLLKARKSEQLLLDYEHRFLRDSRYRARPHWGLDLSALRGKDEVASLYPRWPDWLDVYRQLNRKGTFDGRLTDRLGISVGWRSNARASQAGREREDDAPERLRAPSRAGGDVETDQLSR